jgi:putative restriction endonuclease
MPFGKIHQGNPVVIHLAELFGRSPGAVSWKLVNFASLDPSLQERGIAGAKNASKLDEQIWNEFYQNWDELAFESEKVKAEFENTTLEKLQEADEQTRPKEGLEKEQTVKARVNQNFFRQMILANYDYRCCITGLKQPELLVAGHIKPWSQDKENRINPQNGLAINALHDKAFEEGLITITPFYKIKISPTLKNNNTKKELNIYS